MGLAIDERKQPCLLAALLAALALAVLTLGSVSVLLVVQPQTHAGSAPAPGGVSGTHAIPAVNEGALHDALCYFSATHEGSEYGKALREQCPPGDGACWVAAAGSGGVISRADLEDFAQRMATNSTAHEEKLQSVLVSLVLAGDGDGDGALSADEMGAVDEALARDLSPKRAMLRARECPRDAADASVQLFVGGLDIMITKGVQAVVSNVPGPRQSSGRRQCEDETDDLKRRACIYLRELADDYSGKCDPQRCNKCRPNPQTQCTYCGDCMYLGGEYCCPSEGLFVNLGVCGRCMQR